MFGGELFRFPFWCKITGKCKQIDLAREGQIAAESQALTIGRECRGIITACRWRECQLPFFSGIYREQRYAVLIWNCKPLAVWIPGKAATVPVGNLR